MGLPQLSEQDNAFRLAQSAWAEICTTHSTGPLAVEIIADRIRTAIQQALSPYKNEGTRIGKIERSK